MRDRAGCLGLGLWITGAVVTFTDGHSRPAAVCAMVGAVLMFLAMWLPNE